MNRQYDAKYDFLKFFLSILVVAIHAQLYPLVLYPWLRIAVPLFFMTSSYFFFSKLQAVPVQEHTTMLKKFLSRNIKLYLFWFVILFPATLFAQRDSYFSQGLLYSGWKILRNLFFGSTFFASWYITATILGMTIVYCLSMRIKPWVIFIICLLAFGFVSLWSSYKQLFAAYQGLYTFRVWYNKLLGNPALSFPASLIWIFIGKCFGEKKIKWPTKWRALLIFLVSCAALYGEWYWVRQCNGSYNNDSYFMLLPVCVSLFGWFQGLGTVTCAYAIRFRRASTVIYVVHGCLISFLEIINEKFLHIDSALPLFVVALIGSVVVYLCIEWILHRFSQRKIAKILQYAY